MSPVQQTPAGDEEGPPAMRVIEMRAEERRMVPGWLPAGAAQRTHAAKLTNKCSPGVGTVGNGLYSCKKLRMLNWLTLI